MSVTEKTGGRGTGVPVIPVQRLLAARLRCREEAERHFGKRDDFALQFTVAAIVLETLIGEVISLPPWQSRGTP